MMSPEIRSKNFGTFENGPQAPAVERVGSVIQRMNYCPLEKYYQNLVSHPCTLKTAGLISKAAFEVKKKKDTRVFLFRISKYCSQTLHLNGLRLYLRLT